MSRKLSNLVIQATDTIRELVIIYFGIILLFAALYSFFEHKAFFDSMWWAVVTAMTVGYGDAYPVTVGGRITAIVLMHIVVFGVIPLITARMASKLIVDNDAFTNDEQEEIKNLLRRIDKKVHKK